MNYLHLTLALVAIALVAFSFWLAVARPRYIVVSLIILTVDLFLAFFINAPWVLQR